MHSWRSLASFSLPWLVFMAARVAGDVDIVTSDNADAYNNGAYGQVPNQTFYSSNIMAPLWLVDTWDKASTGSASHIFTNPYFNNAWTLGIFSSKDLSLVYADQNYPSVNDFRVQQLAGEPVLTFWAAYSDSAESATGYGLILDQSYTIIHKIAPKSLPTGLDLHEFELTDDGGAIVVNQISVPGVDLTSVGGPASGTLMDCSFLEVDVVTGLLRFSWNASSHFHLNETRVTWGADGSGPGEFDWCHINAVSKSPDGNYLVSARHFCTVFLVNGSDGSVIWQLGGDGNEFKDLSGGKATGFAFQHHARFVPGNTNEITLLDNQGMTVTSPTPGCSNNCSSGLRLMLDYGAMTARVISQLYHPDSVQDWAEGSYQQLANGNSLLGFGMTGAFVEYTPEGNPVMSVQSGPWANTPNRQSQIYRVFELDWVGKPLWNPSLAINQENVYMSWNGATEVASWVLLGSNSTDINSFKSIGSAARAGFETMIPLNGFDGYIKVQALDAKGNVLGTSNVTNSANETTTKPATPSHLSLNLIP